MPVLEAMACGTPVLVLDKTVQAQQGPERAAEYDWHNVTRRYLELMIPLAV